MAYRHWRAQRLKSRAAKAFFACSNLTDVSIPSSVTIIGDSAFTGCNRLTTVAIPNGVSTIGNYAFYGCSSLSSLTIPGSVANIASRTGMSREVARETLSRTSPQQRLIEPEEVAAIAVFLAQESSKGITGQAINIDGGSVMS